jgi:iron complex transport system permease protein
MALRLASLAALVIAAAVLYQFIAVDMRHFDYAMSIRAPKLTVMLLTAFCIGSASIVFQTLISNTIVTPCLLGMNALYILIHTLVVFVLGGGSAFVTSRFLSFGTDLFIMAVVAVLIYGLLFRRAHGNVLYILLVGTVMSTLFSSVTSTVQRIMDPNEYETLLVALIASFHKVNSGIISFAVVAVIGVIALLWRDLKLLDVISLGRAHAVNLGVDYDAAVRRLLLGVTLFIGIATAMVGPISFLGLIIANLARQIFKTYRHAYLIAGSVFTGMVILLSGQALIEHVFSYTATIGAFINVGGGLYFLWLLLRNRGTN